MAYDKKEWMNGEIIYAEDLNEMEIGIGEASKAVEQINVKLNTVDSRATNLESRADSLESQVQNATSINDELAARVTKLESIVLEE